MGPRNYNQRGETLLRHEDGFDLHKSQYPLLSKTTESTEDSDKLRWIAEYQADVDVALQAPTEVEIATYSGQLTVLYRTEAVAESELEVAA